MKKFLSLLASAFLVSTVVVDAQDNLYLTGSATTVGWTTNGLAMNKITDGWFSLCGNLIKENESADGEYKFLEGNDWIPSYNKGAGDNDLLHRTSYDDPDDKFVITDGQEGFYIVEAITKEMKSHRKMISTLYPIGTATSYNWDLGELQPMSFDPETGIATTNIELTAQGDDISQGRIKFFVDKEWQGPTIFPESDSDTDIIEDTEMNIKFNTDNYGNTDRQFIVKETAKYIITIDLLNMTIKFKKEDANSINVTDADDANAVITYFDLMGNQVINPVKGVYIKKKNLNGRVSASKILLK